MTEGLTLQFESPPPLCLTPPSYALPSPSQLEDIRGFLPGLLSRRLIRPIRAPIPLFFSRVFIVPKKDGPNRLIIDLSRLNELLVTPTFKMERIWDIATCIVEPMWGCTVDLQDAFYHIPMAWFFHAFLAFVVDGQTYVFQVLPFGLAIAPWAFNRITKPITSRLHLILIRFHAYLDDFLILAPSREDLLEQTSVVLSLLDRLGLSVNLKKSRLTPSQNVDYLGVTFHLDTLQLSLPETKVSSILNRCETTLACPRRSRRFLEGLVGLLNFAAPFVPLGRLRLRPVILWMNRHSTALTRDLPVPIDRSLEDLLVPWMDVSYLRTRVPMNIPIPSLHLMTDASSTGWGGTLLPHSTSGVWPPSYLGSSINWLELMAVFLSLQHFLPLLRGRCVQLLSDNTTAVACLLHQGTLRSDPLLDLSVEILEFCLLHSVVLVPKHLCGSLNVLADQASREGPVSTEWSLDPKTFAWLVARFGPFQVDLFATRENHQLPSYVSPCPDPEAAEVNAFSVPWDNWDSVYLFPPVAVLHQVSSLLIRFRGRGVLVAPLYARSGWLPNLLQRSPDPVPLPPGHMLSQKTREGLAFHKAPSQFHLHAWRL